MADVMSSYKPYILEIDNFIMPRSSRKSQGLSGYNPEAFNVEACSQAITDIESGHAVWIPFYDHSTGEVCTHKQCQEHLHLPARTNVLIAVGIFLWDLVHFANWDIAVFCRNTSSSHETDRIRRDREERGYSEDFARQHFQLLEVDRIQYIEPSLHYCGYIAERNDDKYSLWKVEQ